MLEDAYRKGQDAKVQAQHDIETGRDRVSERVGSNDTGATGTTGTATPGPATATQPLGATDGYDRPVR